MKIQTKQMLFRSLIYVFLRCQCVNEIKLQSLFDIMFSLYYCQNKTIANNVINENFELLSKSKVGHKNVSLS